MIIADRYSHKNGEAYISEHHPDILAEIEQVISSIQAESCRLKKPKGKEIERARRVGVDYFYSPPHFNALFDWHFFNLGWDIKPRLITHDPQRAGYREIDMLKSRVGVEVQIGKYSFLTYDIVAKMILFRNLGVIECGVEICPMASMLPRMSSGIGAFEQVVWDLQYRGEADIDMPVLLLGFESEAFDAQTIQTPRLEFLEPEARLSRYSKEGLPSSTLRKVRETGLEI